jgi:hypothetical protein
MYVVIVKQQAISGTRVGSGSHIRNRVTHIVDIVVVDLHVSIAIAVVIKNTPPAVVNEVIVDRPVRAANVDSSYNRIVVKASVALGIEVEIGYR